KTVHDLDNVSHVHIIEYEGDCKELLFEITPGMSVKPEKVPIKAVQINSEGRILKSLLFTPDEERRIKILSSAPLKYLYEPSPAFQKSGGFHSIATHYDLYKLHPNTHLYTSEKLVKDFPGRIFKITGITQANSKRLKTILPDMRASLSVRNFPMAAKDLANKLKIKDGGEITLFACTSFEDQKIIIKCEKT
ncbi:MAG: THUMP-like domain-containing protein, partial [Alphaproteobacteria bacterium]